MKSFSHEKKEKERTLYATGLSFNAKRGEGNKKKKKRKHQKKRKEKGGKKTKKNIVFDRCASGKLSGIISSTNCVS